MKANKALKKLAKIEASLSDLMERYSPGAPDAKVVLQAAHSAVVRAREALSLKASPPAKTALPKPPKKAAAKPAAAKTAKQRMPIKKAVKKSAAKRVAPVPLPAKALAL
jgi:hypothetical protein